MDQKIRYLEDEFEDLTLCYIEQLFRLAYARLGSTEDAEDIVQKTYLKAYRAFGMFRNETSIRNWLTQILLNKVKDHFRKGTRSVSTVDISEVLDEGVSEAAEQGPEAQMCEDEIDPDLMRALNTVPGTLLTPLLLREIHEASYEDIASTLGIPKGTVMSRLFRARALLRRHLQANPKFSGLKNSKQKGKQDDEKRGCSNEMQ